MRRPAILIDLDGTLANISHRREKFLKNNDWGDFNSKINADSLNYWCREIIDKFKSSYKIIIVTGRKRHLEKETLGWLKNNGVFYDDIYFRETKDYRKDYIIKKEIYERDILKKYNVLFVVDDRESVVKMWRGRGLVCLQCDFGEF